MSLQNLLLGSRLRGSQKLKLLGEFEFCPGETTVPWPNCSGDLWWRELGIVRFQCGRNLKASDARFHLVPGNLRDGRQSCRLSAFAPPPKFDKLRLSLG